MGGHNVNVSFGANIEGLIAGVEGVKEQLEGLAGFTEGLTSTFTGIGEAIAAAFAVERLESFIEGIADLGSKLESASAQLGFSTQKVLALQYAAGIADVSIDQATRTIDHFYMATQTAQTATSRQAAAFRALGIDVQDLLNKNLDLNQIFDITVQKLGEYKDGANKSAIVMDLFGNRSAETVRLVNILSAGMGQLEEKTSALGPPSQRYLDVTKEMHVRIVDLETIMQTWKLSLADIANFFLRAAEGAVEFVEIVAGAFHALSTIFEMGLNEVSDFTEGFYKIITTPPGTGYFDKIEEEWHKTVNNIKSDANQGATEINKIIAEKTRLINELEHPTMTEAGTKSSGADAPHVVDSGAVKKDIQVWEDALNEMLLKKQLFGEDALTDELKFWQEKLKIAKAGSDSYNAVQHKIYEVEKQIHQQMLRESQKTEREQQRNWERFFNSFNSGLMSMIKGTGSWRDAVRSAFFSVIENGLKMVEKMLAHWIVAEHTKTAATVAGNAARTASDTSAAKTSSGGFGSAAISQIQGDAAKAYGGVYGFLAPALGPFAAIPAAAAYVAVIGMEALIPSFDVGTWNVPHDMVANLHAGERVLTASENERYSKGGGGGVELHIHGGINDAKSIRNLLMREGGTIAKSIKKQGLGQHGKMK